MAARVILLLSAVARHITNIENLSIRTGLSIGECHELINLCVSWGLMDSRGALTEAGRLELTRLQHIHKRDGLLDTQPGYYYPSSLRDHNF
jgi:hypothetical protein